MSDSTPFEQTEMHLQSALEAFNREQIAKGMLAITMALQSINDRICNIEEKLDVHEADD
jgi:hypothetical protein